MPIVDPAVNDRVMAALSDPHMKVVEVGPRARWARSMIRFIANGALYSGLGAAVLLGGEKVAQISGVAGEIAARVSPMQVLEQKPQQVRWLDMPSSPFLEIARRPDGTYSLDRLVGGYKAAGLSPERALDIVRELPKLSPVLMGVQDDALAKQFQDEARSTVEGLAAEYPQVLARLEKLIEKNRVPESAQKGRWDTSTNWPEVRYAWRAASASPSGAIGEEAEIPGLNMTESRSALEYAVSESGLRALRVSPHSWRSAESVFDLAKGLELANQDLMDSTGWEGQVLGLGGRVVLTMGSPPADTNAAGITWAYSNGAIEITAEWDNLSHEWFHALDFVAAQKTMSASYVGTLSRQIQPFRLSNDGVVFNAWKKTVSDMEQLAPNWTAARHDYVTKIKQLGKDRALNADSNGAGQKEGDYWISKDEALAYSFQAFVSRSNPLVLRTYEKETPDLHRFPSHEEGASQKPMWSALFASMDHLQLTSPLDLSASPEVSSKVAMEGFMGRVSDRRVAVGDRASTLDIAVTKAAGLR